MSFFFFLTDIIIIMNPHIPEKFTVTVNTLQYVNVNLVGQHT